MSDQWIFNAVEWTLTNMTYVALGLFLISIVAAVPVIGRKSPSFTPRQWRTQMVASAAAFAGPAAIVGYAMLGPN
jgi:hypothetical protein